MKSVHIEEKLTKYIEQVCTDAVKAVGADAVLDHWHMIIGHQDLIVDFKFTKAPVKDSEKDDIMKRVMFRLGNNVPNHFNLNVFGPRCYQYYADVIGTMYSFAKNGEFNYGYALAEVHPFGENLVLCHEYGYPIYPVEEVIEDLNDLPSARLQQNGLDIHNQYFFDDFYAAYVKAFGESPLNVWIQMRAGKDISKISSTESIEEIANHDLDTFGCKYYSVCNKACKGCVNTDKCFRDTPIMKDGLVLSRYRAYKQELLMEYLK